MSKVPGFPHTAATALARLGGAARRVRFVVLATAALAMLALSLPPTPTSAADAAADYRLGPEDKVRLSVFEWRASRDEMFEWKAFNSQYTVNASGRLALPLIGEIPAAGFTTATLARDIGEKLRDRLGFATAPDIALEIVQFRPFYVTGLVEKPGEYPYRPGLTVLQATAIAGGQRRNDLAMVRLEREVIASRGDLEIYTGEMTSLMARAARLSAEVKGASKVEFPAALLERASDPNIALLMSQEEQIHSTRTQAFEAQVAALEKLRDFLEKAVESLTGQLAAHDRQVSSTQKELADVKALVARGYSTTARANQLDRADAQMQGDHLRLESELVRNKQEASRADIAILELRNKRSTEATTDLRAVQQRMEEIGRKVATTEKLLNDSEVTAPLLDPAARNRRPELNYTIVRTQDGLSTEIPALESTPVQPGDTIKVELLRSGGSSASRARPVQPDAPKAKSSQSVPAPELRKAAKFSTN